MDQGSQFTCGEWIDTLKAAGVQISMDGKGRWIDNVFIERLWRSVKYDNVYLRAYENGTQLRRGLTEISTFTTAAASISRSTTGPRTMCTKRLRVGLQARGMTDNALTRRDFGGCPRSGYPLDHGSWSFIRVRLFHAEAKKGGTGSCSRPSGRETGSVLKTIRRRPKRKRPSSLATRSGRSSHPERKSVSRKRSHPSRHLKYPLYSCVRYLLTQRRQHIIN